MLSFLVGYMKLLFSKLFVTIFGLGYCGTVLGRVHSKAFLLVLKELFQLALSELVLKHWALPQNRSIEVRCFLWSTFIVYIHENSTLAKAMR